MDRFLDELVRTPRTSAMKHLDEAATSAALNVAEGKGKRSIPDRVRYLEIARPRGCDDHEADREASQS